MYSNLYCDGGMSVNNISLLLSGSTSTQILLAKGFCPEKQGGKIRTRDFGQFL